MARPFWEWIDTCAAGERTGDLAAEYGVHQSHISKIKHNKVRRAA